ncbi:MAG: hypothetical protein M3203_10185, partial [Actinomycetota bacterium]|nr:hypothetical protein [Actinomycetota bacterium]
MRVTAAAAAVTALMSVMVACGEDGGNAMGPVVRAEPTAGTWKTWVLSSGSEIHVPPPPARDSEQAKADLDAVKGAADKRTSATQQLVDKWSQPLATKPWTELALEYVSRQEKNPPLSSRNYALVHVAMHDAVVAAYHWKYQYRVEAPRGVETLVPSSPDPSYPSEHAAMAGAASKVLAFLFPNQSALRLDEMADEAARSRVDAGTNTPTDTEAGLALGHAVANRVIEYAKTDGATTNPWDGRRPPGIGRGPRFWEPPPGSSANPTDPNAGKWKPWVMTSGSQFRPPPPPAYGTPEFRAAAQEIVDIQKNLTEEQKRIAKFWEGAQGTELPAGIALRLAMGDIENAASTGAMATRWTLPQVTRAMAMLNVTMADGGIAAWDSKFTYWNPRPENAIRDLGLDRNWKPYLPTPFFPAYASG